MTCTRIASQTGFTLIEVMVAITLLLVGVLGTVTMIDGANAVTSQTKAREGATAVARSVLEISRGVQYRDLTGAEIMQELGARPGLGDADVGTAGHQIESRNFVYTVTPMVCSMDDAKDGLGDHEEPAVTFCPESAATGADDRNPDDYRRVTVQIDWSLQGGDAESLTQRGLVTNPVGGLGPSVTSLTGPELIVTGATENPTYDIVTSPVADTVSWSVDGARNPAEGAGTSWGFTWPLGPVDTPTVFDCTYILQAEAFDEKGRAGTPNALTVTINRRQPFAPSGFAGGRNLSGDGSTVAYVDLEWNSSPECDVKEYRVYRGTSAGSVTTLVCTRTSSQPKQCIDETAPAGVTLHYKVVAVDVPADGRDEEGDPATLEVESEQGLTAPTPPASLSLCTGDGVSATCPDIDGNPAPDDTAVLSWPEASDVDGEILFYRVYRTDGLAGAEDDPSYADRFDVLYKVPDKPLVFVDATNTAAHSYWVTAVDGLFGESEPVGPVTWQP
jgi:prepilin-type N-terminal cleavage/methylation domain-containing protein